MKKSKRVGNNVIFFVLLALSVHLFTACIKRAVFSADNYCDY